MVNRQSLRKSTPSFSVYRCHATVVIAQSNFGLVSIEDVDVPIKDIHSDVDGLREALLASSTLVLRESRSYRQLRIS